MITAQPMFAHLLAMTDATGLFEHARFNRPSPEHGYCVDDVARGLVVLSRAEAGDAEASEAELNRVAWRYLRFVSDAQAPDGRVVNRCDVQGSWHGDHGVEDCWGRALWGLGSMASRSSDLGMSSAALARFDLSVQQRSPWLRAMAFAGLGAAEVLRLNSAHLPARALLTDAIAVIGPAGSDPAWPWPQARLTYANAVIPDLMLAAGDCLDDDRMIARGLTLLDWLVTIETLDQQLSVTATGGWAPGEPRPAFDQQPIEVATLADACARAFELTDEPRWSLVVDRAAAWFFGSNDAGIPLYDAATGGCCDGLEAHGRNENQGAESTLALISTWQHAGRLALAHR